MKGRQSVFPLVYLSVIPDVPKPSNEAGCTLHFAPYRNHILIRNSLDNDWSGGNLRTVRKWFICVHLHNGTGKRIRHTTNCFQLAILPLFQIGTGSLLYAMT